MAPTSSPSRRADPRAADPRPPSARPKGLRGRVRWRRIPGRVILALCFGAGIVALAAAVLPFTTTTADDVTLRCGPAVFEVLMPADPAFDDIPENVGCAAPAETRLIVAGAVLAGAILVAVVTERRTRRGNNRRDTRWLAAPKRRRPRRRATRSAKAGPTRGVSSSSAKGDPPAVTGSSRSTAEPRARR